MTIEQCYEDHKRLIFKISWRCHYQTGIPLEELISEMNVVFCEAYQKYDSSRNDTFAKYLGFCCRNRVNNMLTALGCMKRKMIKCTDEELNPLSHDPEKSVIVYDEFVNNPNPVIREIARIVSTTDVPRKNFRGWLKQELRKSNFTFAKIDEAFKMLHSVYA